MIESLLAFVIYVLIVGLVLWLMIAVIGVIILIYLATEEKGENNHEKLRDQGGS